MPLNFPFLRAKTWGLLSGTALAIFVLPQLPFGVLRLVFAAFFAVWALVFYVLKVRPGQELVTDGLWWVPYFLVLGLGFLAFSEKYEIFFSVRDWSKALNLAFLLVVGALLLFWEWPPWFDHKKTLLSKGPRTVLAWVLFVFGLIMWVYGLSCVLNRALDRSEAVAHDCLVMEKIVYSHRHAADVQYIILVKPWPGHKGSNTFLLSQDEYARVKTHQTMARVWEKPGFLGFAWVSEVKILTAPGQG